MNTRKIILASTSPRRKELLEQLGLEFDIIASDYEEDMSLKLTPQELARTLALGKAQNVVTKVKKGIIIGCDTIISVDYQVLGKTKNEREAKETLRTLSGKTFQVITGLAVIDKERDITINVAVSSDITFKELSEKEIEKYVLTGEYIGHAGAFAIQGIAASFIKEIHGSYSNIVGMPLYTLVEALKKLDVTIF